MKLGSDSSTSASEAMATLRHKSAASHEHRSKNSGIREISMHKALDVIKNSYIACVFGALQFFHVNLKFQNSSLT